MKICTITCHDVYNYGASLQAYALMRYLNTLNHDTSIIDYKPEYLSRRYNCKYIDPQSKYYKICQKYPLLYYLYILKNYIKFIPWYPRKKAFDKFTRDYLILTPRYNNFDELENNPPVADLYIAGSDQIWNSLISNGKDPAFYLSFIKNKRIKSSYAASFGISSIPQEYKDFVKSQLINIGHISVREKTAVLIVEELGLKAKQVLDPVFLLDKDEWISLMPQKITKDKYLLVYDFVHDDPNIKLLAHKIAEERNLKIYSINDYSKINYADKNISNAGPLDFLYYLYHADTIISSSFHATAFSIIFNKNFYTFQVSHNKNKSRMTDLLDLFNLNTRFINTINDYKHYEIINYKDITNKINASINESKDFIKQLINK